MLIGPREDGKKGPFSGQNGARTPRKLVFYPVPPVIGTGQENQFY